MAARTGTYYSGTITGQNGTLITLLDAVLVTGEGWAKEFTGTNRAIYRAPVGNRFRLRVLDNGTANASGAREALVRAGEGATNVDTLVDPFPTVAQHSNANCVWRKSETDDATTRPWYAWADDKAIFLFIASDPSNNYGNPFIFGDMEPTYPGDNYCTLITTLNAGNSVGSRSIPNAPLAADSSSAGGWFARTEDGLLKSPCAAYWNWFSGVLGSTNSTDAGTYPHPRTLDLPLTPVMIVSVGGTVPSTVTTSQSIRAYVPGVFQPFLQYSPSGLASLDTFTDTAYDAGSEFIIVALNTTSSFGGGGIVLQTAADWRNPTF